MSYIANNYFSSSNLYSSEGPSRSVLHTEPERSNYERNGVLKLTKPGSAISFKETGLKTEPSTPRRVDKFGNPIIKKKNLHKISFADQFASEGKKLSDEKKVASFKNYNANLDDNGKYCFTCLIV